MFTDHLDGEKYCVQCPGLHQQRALLVYSKLDAHLAPAFLFLLRPTPRGQATLRSTRRRTGPVAEDLPLGFSRPPCRATIGESAYPMSMSPSPPNVTAPNVTATEVIQVFPRLERRRGYFSRRQKLKTPFEIHEYLYVFNACRSCPWVVGCHNPRGGGNTFRLATPACAEQHNAACSFPAGMARSWSCPGPLGAKKDALRMPKKSGNSFIVHPNHLLKTLAF